MLDELIKVLSSYGSPTLVALLVLGITITLAVFHKSKLIRKPFTVAPSAPVPGTLEDRNDTLMSHMKVDKDRPFGEWNPLEFCYPSIEACAHALAEIKPIPYRPFRWGTYHVTMGIRNMLWNDWIELDDQHEKYHSIKTHRVETRGEGVIRVLSDDANPGVVRGGAEAAVELVHELAEYLHRRYPKDFQVVRYSQRREQSTAGKFRDWGWEGLPPVKTVTITSLGVSYDLPISVDDGIRAAERALEIAGLLIQDDLALMIEGNDGRYYFQAGSICLAGFWRMQDKIGLPLDDIHITGNVPQYKEKLHASLERFFRRLPVDKPVIRNNYFIQTNPGDEQDSSAETDPEQLAWAESTLGSEDGYEHGPRTSDCNRKEEKQFVKVEGIRLRTERQTLRRLPRSGAVVFTIRTYLIPVVDLARERGVPGRMASALRSWPADVEVYKGKERGGWWGPLLEYLDASHRGQIERGETAEDEKGREKGYPM